MTLTIEGCHKHIVHTLGGEPSMDSDEIVNACGTWFTAAHDWKYLERPSVLLPFTLNQSYITLPTDLGDIIKIQFTNGLTARFFLTTLGTIADYRTSQMNFGISVTYGCMVYAPSTNPLGGPPTPRLEIYPTPQSNLANALTLFYRSTWAPVTPDDSETFVNIPQYAEPAFLQALRQFARGYQDEEHATMGQRLADLMAGPVWGAAIEQDGLTQPEYGKMRGGAVAIGIPPPTTFASPWSISSP
jgi:hypothetical protein